VFLKKEDRCYRGTVQYNDLNVVHLIMYQCTAPSIIIVMTMYLLIL